MKLLSQKKMSAIGAGCKQRAPSWGVSMARWESRLWSWQQAQGYEDRFGSLCIQCVILLARQILPSEWKAFPEASWMVLCFSVGCTEIVSCATIEEGWIRGRFHWSSNFSARSPALVPNAFHSLQRIFCPGFISPHKVPARHVLHGLRGMT